MKIWCPKEEMMQIGVKCRRHDVWFCRRCYGDYCPISGCGEKMTLGIVENEKVEQKKTPQWKNTG